VLTVRERLCAHISRHPGGRCVSFAAIADHFIRRFPRSAAARPAP
jgi:hypothetical protein